MFVDIEQTTLDKKAMQLGRKKLLAELELSAGDNLEIQGIPFSKNDIIDYFGELQKDDLADYYWAVEEDKVLRKFLEEYHIGEGASFKDAKLYQDPAFIQWISPYFYTAWGSFVDNCFGHRDDTGLSTILRNRQLMTERDSERSWNSLSLVLADNISLLEEYQRQDKRADETISTHSITYMLEFNYVTLIRRLPDSRFAGIREKYAFVMMQVCIYTFNRHIDYRIVISAWMDNAIGLADSQELKNKIADKQREMDRIEGKKKPTGIWRFALPAIVVLIKVATCHSISHLIRPHTHP